MVNPHDVVVLLLNYQKLDIEENSTTVGWMTDYSDGICDTFVLQGFTLENGVLTEQEFNITTVDGYTATIPSDELMNSAGDAILYRLIAVDENANICSETITLMIFYRFDGKRLLGYYHYINALKNVPY